MFSCEYVDSSGPSSIYPLNANLETSQLSSTQPKQGPVERRSRKLDWQPQAVRMKGDADVSLAPPPPDDQMVFIRSCCPAINSHLQVAKAAHLPQTASLVFTVTDPALTTWTPGKKRRRRSTRWPKTSAANMGQFYPQVPAHDNQMKNTNGTNNPGGVISQHLYQHAGGHAELWNI